MKYNTRDVYFGYPTYNVVDMKYNVNEYDFWSTAAEAFLKKGDKYIRIKDKTEQELCPYYSDAKDYLTVSGLEPIVNMMNDKKEIPEEISSSLINLYLFKYKINKNREKRYAIEDVKRK